jgi:hypothetical protein
MESDDEWTLPQLWENKPLDKDLEATTRFGYVIRQRKERSEYLLG